MNIYTNCKNCNYKNATQNTSKIVLFHINEDKNRPPQHSKAQNQEVGEEKSIIIK